MNGGARSAALASLGLAVLLGARVLDGLPDAVELLFRCGAVARAAAWAALLGLLASLLGRRLAVALDLEPPEAASALCLAFGLGFGVLGLAALGLGYAGFVTPASALALAVLVFLLGLSGLSDLRGLARRALVELDFGPSWLLVLPLLLLPLCLAPCPPLYGDEVTYQAWLPQRFVELGRIPVDGEGCRNLHFPLLPHALAALGLASGVPEAPRADQLLCGLALLVGLGGLARRCSVPPAWVAALFLANPIVALSMGLANVTMAKSLAQLVVLLALLELGRRPSARAAVGVGLLLGCFGWIKQVALVSFGFVGLLLVLGQGAPRRHLGLALAVGLAVLAPLPLKGWLVTGDPGFPYGWPQFAGAGWDSFLQRNELAVYGRLDYARPVDGFRLLRDVALGPDRTDQLGAGVGSHLTVLAPLLLLVPAAPGARALALPAAFAVVYVAGWAFGPGPVYSRVLVPVLPVLCLLLALGLRELQRRAGSRLTAAAALCAAAAVLLQFPVRPLARAVPWLLGVQSAGDYRAAAWGDTWRIMVAADGLLPAGTPVLSLFAPQRLFTRCRLFPSHDLGGSFAMATPRMRAVLERDARLRRDILRGGAVVLDEVATREAALAALARRGLRHVLVSEAEVRGQVEFTLLPLLAADLVPLARCGSATLYRLRE